MNFLFRKQPKPCPKAEHDRTVAEIEAHRQLLRTQYDNQLIMRGLLILLGDKTDSTQLKMELTRRINKRPQ